MIQSKHTGGAGSVQVADAKEKLLEAGGNKADGMEASCLSAACFAMCRSPPLLGIRRNMNLDKGGFFFGIREEPVSLA